jgi:hypothetical protein
MTPLHITLGPDAAAVIESAATDYRLRRQSALALPTLIVLWSLYAPDESVAIKVRGLCPVLRSNRHNQAGALRALVDAGYLACEQPPARQRCGVYRVLSQPVGWTRRGANVTPPGRTAA